MNIEHSRRKEKHTGHYPFGIKLNSTFLKRSSTDLFRNTARPLHPIRKSIHLVSRLHVPRSHTWSSVTTYAKHRGFNAPFRRSRVNRLYKKFDPIYHLRLDHVNHLLRAHAVPPLFSKCLASVAGPSRLTRSRIQCTCAFPSIKLALQNASLVEVGTLSQYILCRF